MLTLKVSPLQYSGISMLGGPGYVWSYGVVTVVQQLSTYVAVPVTVWVFVPLLHGLKLTSAYGKIVILSRFACRPSR